MGDVGQFEMVVPELQHEIADAVSTEKDVGYLSPWFSKDDGWPSFDAQVPPSTNPMSPPVSSILGLEVGVNLKWLCPNFNMRLPTQSAQKTCGILESLKQVALMLKLILMFLSFVLF